MKNKKFLSVLLCLALLASLPVLPGGAAAADDPADNGMKISKTATANADGSYTITLEAYATGSQVTTTVQKDIPTDIVLVIDQSGSMADDIGQVQYKAYTGNDTQNKSNYEKRHNGGSANLWHKLDDGSYVSVSVTKTQRYTELGRLVNYSEKYYNKVSEDCYWYYANNLYEKVGEEYKQVTIEYEQEGLFEEGTFIYTFSDGTTVQSKGFNGKPNFGERAPLYTPAADGNDTVYTYIYTDATGAVQTIGTSTGANTRFTPAFYQRSTTSGGGSRLAAIKSAAGTFVNNVTAKAKGDDGQFDTEDDVNHRIAVVGYADTDWDYGYNTGVFIGSTLKRYQNDDAGVYGTALQDMSTIGGKNNVTASINALQASGATRTDYGLIMAQGILNANPVPEGQKRNRVVIVFTDGAPTNSNGFERAVANSAISTANAIKAGGTTVYSIGIFSGADASTAGKEPVEDYYEDYYRGPNYTDAEMSAACNWFMQKVSSNNGTPRTPSYYLSAGDAASLNNIFQQISDQIQTGGSSTTLNSSTVIKDIISPSFVLPEGTTASDITLETYACTGVDANGSRTFATTKNEQSMGERVELTSSENNVDANVPDQVNVTGFDFSANWCGTETVNGKVTYRGNKLVIKIKVEPRPGFLGGNDVYTNTSAGVYENASATEPVLPFDRPQTDVTIKEPKITLPDANVYLGAYFSETVNAEDLKKGTKIKFGENIELDLSKPDQNWGLEAWQTEYVSNIEVKVTDKDGNVVTDFAKLTDDTQYKVSVSIKPKTLKEGNNGFDKSAEGTIHVFKPELTFNDSAVRFMVDTVDPDYFNDTNKGSEVWKHGEKTSTDSDVQMMGIKPNLLLNYTPQEDGLDANGLVISAVDIPVAVTVKIGNHDVTDYTTFVHQACNPACGWTNPTTPTTPGDPAFLLHVKDVYADLTIKKTGASVNPDGTGLDAGQSFLFTVTGPDNYSTEVIIVGNGSVTLKNLKIGTYTVTEDTNWSWRYTPTTNNNPQTITLEANKTNTVTINNTRNEDKWLDGNVHKDNKFTGAAATTE